MDEVNVRLAGGYYFHTLKRAITELQPLFNVRKPARVVVDMSDLTFLGPAALALTAAALHRIYDAGLAEGGSYLRAPRNKAVFNYLHRVDLFRVVFDAEFPSPSERRETVGFRECQHFVEDEERRRVASSVLEVFDEVVTTDRAARTSLDLALDELTENVLFHADAPMGGYVAAQALSHSKEIEVGIVDLGVGIAGSLAKNPDYAQRVQDDVSAITTALKPTVTATPGRNSGYGLTFTQFLMNMNEGRLLVRSGHGHVQRGDRVIEKFEEHPLPGTLVGLRLRTDKPFDFKKAYTLLNRALESLGKLPSHD